MPTTATAARKSFLLLGANLFGSALGFLATFVIARAMGAEALGTIGYIMGLTGIVGFVSNLGYAQAHARYAAGRQDIGDQVSSYSAVVGLLTLVQIVALALVPWIAARLERPPLDNSTEWAIYLAFSVGLVLTSLTRIFSVTYQAQEEAAKVSLALALSGLAVAIAQISVALSGLGLIALGIAYQTEAAVKLVVLWLTSGKMSFGRPKSSIIKQYSRYTAPIAIRNILTSVYGNADKILLQQLGSTQQVGFYVGNLGTAAAINRLSLAAMRIFFPRTVADIDQGNLNAVRRRLSAVLRYLLFIAVPIIAIVIVYSEPIVWLTLGPEFLPSAQTLSILAVQAMVQMMVLTYTHIILALEKHAYFIPINLIAVMILLVSDALLIPSELFGLPLPGLGSAGAAIGLTLASISTLVMQIGVTNRFAQINFSLSLLWFAVGGGLMVIVLRLPLFWQADLNYWHMLILVPIGVAVFTSVMLFARQITPSELLLFVQTLDPRPMIDYVRREIGGGRIGQ